MDNTSLTTQDRQVLNFYFCSSNKTWIIIYSYIQEDTWRTIDDDNDDDAKARIIYAQF